MAFVRSGRYTVKAGVTTLKTTVPSGVFSTTRSLLGPAFGTRRHARPEIHGLRVEGTRRTERKDGDAAGEVFCPNGVWPTGVPQRTGVPILSHRIIPAPGSREK